MQDKCTNRSRGFGFITFYKANIDRLLEEQPHFIDGKKIECKKAIPKEHITSMNENNQEADSICLKIFVGGLPPLLDESGMYEYFIQFGEIDNCSIMHDKPSGKSRGI